MRKKLGLMIGAVLVTLGGASLPATADGGGQGSDRAAIERLRVIQEDAWGREDGAAFASIFTPDGDVVTFNGDHLHTRPVIAARMQFYFDNYIDYSRIRTLSEQLRFTGPNSAIAVRHGCLLAKGETECRADSYSVNTNVFVKRHGKWLQESFQNTRVQPLP